MTQKSIETETAFQSHKQPKMTKKIRSLATIAPYYIHQLTANAEYLVKECEQLETEQLKAQKRVGARPKKK